MLEEDIGSNAKAIWQLLLDYGMLSVTQICKLSHFTEDTATQVIDRLKQENKIKIVEKEKIIYVELTANSFFEMHF